MAHPRAIYQWLANLVTDVPIITPSDPDPPFYDEVASGPEHDLGQLHTLVAAVEPDDRVEGLVIAVGAWCYDYSLLARAGHDLCFELGVATGEIADPGTFDSETTDRLPVLYATRWEPSMAAVDEEPPMVLAAPAAAPEPEPEVEPEPAAASLPEPAGPPVLPAARPRRWFLSAAACAAAAVAVLVVATRESAPPSGTVASPAQAAAVPVLPLAHASYPMCRPNPAVTSAAGAATQPSGLEVTSMCVANPDGRTVTRISVTVEPINTAFLPPNCMVSPRVKTGAEIPLSGDKTMVVE